MNQTTFPPDGSIPGFLGRRKIVYTYTMLNGYRTCGHSMFRRYIKRDIPYVQSEEAKRGDAVHVAFEQRVGSHKPLPADMQHWEPFAAALDKREPIVEQKLAITKEGRSTGFWDSDCWFRGKVDVVLRQNEKLSILDWKTNKTSKYEDPFELECGALLLKAKYPEITFAKGNYVWLAENRLGQSYDLSRFRDTYNEINRLVSMVEADRQLGEFEKKQSGICHGWCDVKDCEFNRPKK